MMKFHKYIPILALVLFTILHGEATNETTYVTYDSRSLVIHGNRELLYSGSVHYPRVPVEEWENILDKCKEGGLNLIQTYVFWNLHEPVKGQYNFTGQNDIVRFIKLIGERGMWATLRVGPFVQAEWNHGGYPYWLRKEPNIAYRTDNPVYMEHMERWVTKIISLMKEHMLFASQGGPIILSQVENEYDHIRGAYRNGAAERYIRWAAKMAVAQNTGVPWMMCKQRDAPGEVINTCNGRHCGDTFEGPNAHFKPSLWTENWTAQYRVFGDVPSQRAAEDIAFGVARWFSKNGSHNNYYMYYGGTNYGKNAAAFSTTRYYDEAPLDEYGLKREPKWGHLRDLHRALTLSKKALLSGRYGVQKFGQDLEARFYEKGNLCAAFLWNNKTHASETVKFKGKQHTLPPKSISILPDCKTVVYNTDHIVSQHSAREFVRSDRANKGLKWEKTTEHLPTMNNFYSMEPREQFHSTEDKTDYIWYTTRVDLDTVDLPFRKSLQPVLWLKHLGHAMHVFVNGEFIGTKHGSHREAAFTYQAGIRLKEGLNNITVLSSAVGMPDGGSNMEKRWTGLKNLGIQGLGTGNIDLSLNGWHHKIGMEGEKHQYFTEEGSKKAKWAPATGARELFTWYKTYFDAPEGDDPVAIRMANMCKGMVWVNGRSIGRYWSSFLSVKKEPSQKEYHIPRAFLKPRDNFLVIFDESRGNIDRVQIEIVNRDTICSYIAEDMAPNVMSWKRDEGDFLAAIDDLRPKASLKCPKNKIISRVEFASFGNPVGVCGYFLLGNCTYPDTQKIVEQHCLGKDSCTIPVDRKLFNNGNNNCAGVSIKSLAVQVRCSRTD
ncbi:beta-galactosidase 13-like isoform X2 [Amaranthus tricolor]|uniref:beta-galactosidase 13-like isoform X2 n=1 Tax=Amaranthus tricolor TaxID=29722 RepID=UPI0025860B0A|nr:beta-galactosidase 13-like isoform X2 [Amaranthus tricolor]